MQRHNLCLLTHHQQLVLHWHGMLRCVVQILHACVQLHLQWWTHAASVPAEACMPAVSHFLCCRTSRAADSCCNCVGMHAISNSFVLLQNFPNAINTPSFPDSVLRPGHTYQNVCIWRFKTLPRQGRTQRLFVGLGVVLILVAAIAFYTQYYNVNSRYRLRAPCYDKT